MQSRGITALALGALLAAVVVGCGSGGATTVIKEAPAETVERTTTVEVPADPPPEPVAKKASKPKPSSPPDTVGLTLTLAEELLEEAGYRVDAENTDTALGIIDTDNYTICTQDPPRGTVVHVLAQKYGC